MTTPDFFFPPPGEGLDKQQTRSAHALGFRPAVIDQLKNKTTRWAVWRWGFLLHAEGDFNATVHVASLRKTCYALAVGAALQQRRIPSLGQKLSVWEKDLKNHHADATWWHVLTQSTGFDYPYGAHPAYKPGQIWTYSDLNALRLTDALAKVYGRKDHRDDFAGVLRAAYFEAIGLRGGKASPRYDGAVLDLDLEDMGRIGLLALARGRWAGRQIVPRSFVEELETKRTRGMKTNYDGPNDGKISMTFKEAPYGFLTWVNTDGDVYPKADRAWAWGTGYGGNTVFWNRNNGVVYAAHGRDREAAIPDLIEANLVPEGVHE